MLSGSSFVGLWLNNSMHFGIEVVVFEVPASIGRSLLLESTDGSKEGAKYGENISGVHGHSYAKVGVFPSHTSKANINGLSELLVLKTNSKSPWPIRLPHTPAAVTALSCSSNPCFSHFYSTHHV